MKAKRLLFLVMAICLASGVKAQFYDGPEDIYFYVLEEYVNDYAHDPSVLIYNFDGRKAVRWAGTRSAVTKLLAENPNYYEDKEETSEYDLKYVSFHASGTNYEYYFNGSRFVNNFSSDRKHLKCYSWYGYPVKNKEEHMDYIRVDRSYFKKNIGRSKTPRGTLYE